MNVGIFKFLQINFMILVFIDVQVKGSEQRGKE
jgi:hypothetical protein